MLVTTLATALLAPSVSPPDQYDLAALLPGEPKFQMLMGDLSTMLRSDARGPLEKLLQDARFFNAIETLEGDRGAFDAVETEAAFDAVKTLAMHVRGGAIASEFMGEEDVMILLTHTGFGAALDDFLDDSNYLVEEVEFCGDALIKVEDPASGTYVLASDGPLWVCWYSEEVEGEIEDKYAFVLDRLHASPSPPENPWWERVGAPTACTVVEIHAQFFVTEEQGYRRATPSENNHGTIHFALSQDPARGLGFRAALLDPQDGIVHPIMGAFRPVDADVLSWAPSGAKSAIAAGLDVGDFILRSLEAAKELAGRGDFDPASVYAQLLAVGESTFGLDVEEKLLNNLTGDFFFVQWEDAFEALTTLERDPAKWLESGFVVGCTFEDNEPFYEVFDVLESYLQDFNLRTDTRHGFDVWTVEPKEGVLISVALGETSLHLGADARLDEVLVRANSRDDGLASESTLKVATEDSPGQAHILVDAAAAFDLLDEEFAASLGVPKDKLEGALLLMEAIADVAGRSLMASFTFEDDLLTLRLLGR